MNIYVVEINVKQCDRLVNIVTPEASRQAELRQKKVEGKNWYRFPRWWVDFVLYFLATR